MGEELCPHSQNKTKNKKAMGTAFHNLCNLQQKDVAMCCKAAHSYSCLVATAPARSTTSKGNFPLPPRKDSNSPLTTMSSPLSDSGRCYWHHPWIMSKQQFKIHLPQKKRKWEHNLIPVRGTCTGKEELISVSWRASAFYKKLIFLGYAWEKSQSILHHLMACLALHLPGWSGEHHRSFSTPQELPLVHTSLQLRRLPGQEAGASIFNLLQNDLTTTKEQEQLLYYPPRWHSSFGIKHWFEETYLYAMIIQPPPGICPPLTG